MNQKTITKVPPYNTGLPKITRWSILPKLSCASTSIFRDEYLYGASGSWLNTRGAPHNSAREELLRKQDVTAHAYAVVGSIHSEGG